MNLSPSNSHIKILRKLLHRKYREESGCYYLEGPRHILEAIASDAIIEYVVICNELLGDNQNILPRINQKLQQDQIFTVSAETFRSFSTKEGPKGIASVVHQKWSSLKELSNNSWGWLALSNIANPGNLGTIIRTCDAVGIDAVILLDQSTDPYDPTCLRACMGTNFSVKLVKTSFTDMFDWKKSQGIPMVGTSDRAQLDYHHAEYPERFILLMGSEREGLTKEEQSVCDMMVGIPMLGQADSLNLAIATSLVLYEMYNQKRDKHD